MRFRYIYILTFTLLLFCFYGCHDSGIPTLDFHEVSMEKPDPQGTLGTLTLIGNVNAGDLPALTDQGFYISTNIDDLDNNSDDTRKFSADLLQDGGFQTEWSNIALDSLFFIKAYAVFQDDNVEGNRTVFSKVSPFSFNILLFTADDVIVTNDQATVKGFISGMEILGISIEDHGFIYSQNSTAILKLGELETYTVSLGPLKDDGIFSDPINGLAFNTEYYARAWALTANTIYYSSNTISFKVRDGWKPLLNDDPFSLVFPYGGVFDGQGYFMGCKDADGIDCLFDSNQPIWQYRPPSSNSFGEWSELAHPHDLYDPRFNAFSFIIGDTLYVGFGEGINSNLSIELVGDIWKTHKNSISTEGFSLLNTPIIPPKRTSAVAFTKNGKGYLGTGKDPEGNLLNDFWEYNPATGNWRELNPMPFQEKPSLSIQYNKGRREAIAFSFSNHPDCFVGGGAKGACVYNDFWRFTPPLTDNPSDIGEWSTTAVFFPGDGRIDAISFNIDDKGYLGLGFSIGLGYLNDMWKLTPNNPNLFEEVTSFPGKKRYRATGFAINNIGYVGQGQTSIPTQTGGANPFLLPDMWQYFPEIE